MRYFLVLVLLLSGCAGLQLPGQPAAANQPAAATPTAPPTNPLVTLPLADAQAALALAQSGNDTLAVPCYTWLVGKLQAVPQITVPTGAAGLITMHEQLRLAKLQAGNLPAFSQGAAAACGGMVFDDETTVSALTALIATH